MKSQSIPRLSSATHSPFPLAPTHTHPQTFVAMFVKIKCAKSPTAVTATTATIATKIATTAATNINRGGNRICG